MNKMPKNICNLISKLNSKKYLNFILLMSLLMSLLKSFFVLKLRNEYRKKKTGICTNSIIIRNSVYTDKTIRSYKSLSEYY